VVGADGAEVAAALEAMTVEVAETAGVAAIGVTVHSDDEGRSSPSADAGICSGIAAEAHTDTVVPTPFN
jgi:hypothetical protein